MGARFMQGQHDACEFAEALVDTMNDQELEASRSVSWPGVTSGDHLNRATEVDKLFSFVEEIRLECNVCGHPKRRF